MKRSVIVMIILAAFLAGCAPGQSPEGIQAQVNTAVAQTMEAQQRIEGFVAQTVAAQSPLSTPTAVTPTGTPTTIPISLQFTSTVVIPTSSPSTSSFKPNPNITDTLEPPVPGLTLTMTSDHITPIAFKLVGEVIKYTYKLRNTGNVTLSGPITVSDDKATVTCDQIDSLAPQTSMNCTGSYKVTKDDLDNVLVKNKATGHANFNGTAVTSKEVSLTVYSTDVTVPVAPPLFACSVFTSSPEYKAEINAGSKFDIKWIIVNKGTRAWDAGMDLKYTSGSKMTKTTLVEIPKKINPNGSFTLLLDAVAPNQDGLQYMTWTMEGQFCEMSVIIIVK
jgi:hypothetical protein